MPRTVRLPSRFRTRLIVLIVAAVGLSAGALSVGSLLVVREQRMDTFAKRIEQQARVALELSHGESSAAALDRVISLARTRTGFETLVVADQTVASDDDLSLADVPVEVQNDDSGDVVASSTELFGEPYRVVAGDVPETGGRARLYFFFSEADVRQSLEQLRNVLFGGWLIVMILAGLFAAAVARRTLRPVQEATNAAQALTEGLLDTRLPDSGKDEFSAWAKYFNEMAAALQTKIDQLSAARDRERRFTADVAHDLRTPLAGMMTSASLLEESLDDNEQTRRYAGLLVADVRRLRNLVVDLLDIARLDADKQVVELQPVELKALLEDVVISSKWSDSVSIDARPHVTMSDPRRLERIFTNLLDNALAHGGGRATVSVRVDEESVSIDVDDAGPGIPEDQLETIFDRFHKGSESRSTEGSGLGLAIAARHAEILGGVLAASNRPEGGARFHLTIPAHPEPQES